MKLHLKCGSALGSPCRGRRNIPPEGVPGAFGEIGGSYTLALISASSTKVQAVSRRSPPFKPQKVDGTDSNYDSRLRTSWVNELLVKSQLL
jgi:hypothetical protein